MEPGNLSLRHRQLEEIAEALPQRATALAQIFLTRSSVCVSRTEAGVLGWLAAGPRRISHLAAAEHVTQPAITLLVNRLQQRGWVLRAADPHDGRAVLVGLTPDGKAALNRLRAEYRTLLHEQMQALDDRQVDTLAGAVQILDQLIQQLREHSRQSLPSQG